MTFKHVFLSTAAASSLLLAVAALEPAAFLAMKAQAATNASVNINFYDDLAPYGNWVLYHDRYVWIPEGVDDGWRPYTKGHWAYTRNYGWIWVSDERFGWATYHYGRWGYARNIGWYWVPGRRWAPAWVAWSYDGDDIAWAPLPPDYYDGSNIVKSFGFIPDYYWQAVPVSAFLSDNLSGHMFRDRDRVRRVIQNSELRTVRIVNNIVLNKAIKVDDIEEKTKKKVVVLEVKAVDNPDAAGRADSNSVAIFSPEVKEDPNGKPTKTKNVAEVVKQREEKAIPTEEQPSVHAATPTVIKPKKDATNADVPPIATASTDQPDIDKTVEAPADAQTVAVDTPRVSEFPPNEPTKVIQAPAAANPALPPSKSVTLDTVGYDQSGNIVFGGRGPANSKVQLYVDDNAYGLAFINDNGTWSFASLSPLTVGLHAIRAVEISSDGALKSRIEMPFYREEPAKVATAPLTPPTPEAPKPAEVATVQKAPAPTPPVDGKKKGAPAPDMEVVEKKAQVPAEAQTVPVDEKKKATASTDQPDIEKTVEAPADKPTVTSENKEKEATASIDQPEIEKVVKTPAGEQTAMVDEKKKATASIDQPEIEKTVEVPAEEPTATVDEKKKATASIDQPEIEKTVEAPAEEQAVSADTKKKKKKAAPIISKKKKKAEKAVNTALKGQRKCDPTLADCPSALTPSKLKRQSAKRVIPKSNLPDVGAENWRVECSARFGGWTKASETYVSSAGKRVSCAIRPKSARG